NSCRNSLSGVSGFGSLAAQNFVTNSERDTGSESTFQSRFSSLVKRTRTGPSFQFSLGGSATTSVIWKSRYAAASVPADGPAGSPLDAIVLRAFSKASTAFFEYIPRSTEALGLSARQDSN